MINVEATTGRELSNQWPHIRRFLRIDGATGWVDDDYGRFWLVEHTLSPAETAAAYEEWADFYEWRLEQQAEALAVDRVRRHLVAAWTDSMAYSCRRSAAWARGEDPGECVPQAQRRPDLYAESQAIVAEIIAELDPCHRPAGHLVLVG